jgi:hypothetical protein
MNIRAALNHGESMRYSFPMHKTFVLLLLLAASIQAAELPEAAAIKFALYSSGWGENTDDGLRLVVNNQTQKTVRLDSIVFLGSSKDSEAIRLTFNLEVPAQGSADTEIDYIDLLADDECVDRTMAENSKLVEISNYTLNPSVRNLIIEDTDSFRIYQCVKTVHTTWTDIENSTTQLIEEWVLFHFETRREF